MCAGVVSAPVDQRLAGRVRGHAAGLGVLLAIAGSKPRAGRVLLAWACASLLLMLALTWLLHLAQHPVR